jgi:endoglucanase
MQGTDYIFPDTDAIQTLKAKGMNIFRVPFLMERLVPDSLAGSFDSAYLKNLTSVSFSGLRNHAIEVKKN